MRSTMSEKPTSDAELVGEVVSFCRTLARSAGELALSYFKHVTPHKKQDSSLVTEADIAVQQYLYDKVSNRFPDHRFLGEEMAQIRTHQVPTSVEFSHSPSSYSLGIEGCPGSRFLWITDPIDGTAAFAKGFPVWGVSIAVLLDLQPLVGAFYMPVTGELFIGVANLKPTCDGTPISMPGSTEIDKESVLLTYSSFHRDFTSRFSGKIRSLGSTVAHICYVARGSAWGAVLSGIHIWDVVAGQIIVESAGGEIRDFAGNLFEPTKYLDKTCIKSKLLVTPKGCHGLLLQHLERIGAE